MIRFDLGDLSLNTGIPDAQGSLWYATEFEGWAGPSLRQTTVDPTARHGTLLAENLLGSRAITLSGICKAQNADAMWDSYNYLLALTNNLYEEQRLTVYERVPKFVKVVQGDAPEVQIGLGSHFPFTLTLLANDPLKYAVEESSVTIGSGGTGIVTNEGTFPATPRIVTGGSVSLTNTTTGGRLYTSQNLPSGTVLDFEDRSVTSENVSNYNRLAPGSTWWALARGINRVRNQGSRSAIVYFRHTYT
jgi:hypothetical protein